MKKAKRRVLEAAGQLVVDDTPAKSGNGAGAEPHDAGEGDAAPLSSAAGALGTVSAADQDQPQATKSDADPRQQVDHIKATAINAARQYPFSCAQSTSTTLRHLGYDVVADSMDANAQIAELTKLCQGPDATWEKTVEMGQAWRWANEGHAVVAGQKAAGEGYVTMLLGGPGRRSEMLHSDVPLVAGGAMGAASRAGESHVGLVFAASDLKLKKIVYYRPKQR
jgi:hypothetical protein